MAITRWNPFAELELMSDRLNKVLAWPVMGRTGQETMTLADWAPACDIAETETEYLIKAELPDVKKEDVKVAVENGVLTLSGERKTEKEEKGKRYHRIERSYGSFVRSFRLPDDVDDAKMAAQYENGVLNVHLPKSEKAKPRAVAIKVT